MDRYDVLALLGLLMFSAGAYLIYPPLGLIVPGAAFVALGVLGAPAGRGERQGRER